MGEFTNFIKEKPTEEVEWRKLIYRLTVMTKQKDACIWDLAERSGDDPRFMEIPEYQLMREWQKQVVDNNPASIADPMCESLSYGMEPYEKEALEVLRVRAKGGGMLDDRFWCLAAMVLIKMRGIDQEAIKEDLVEGLKKWQKRTGRKKPRTVNLPWYVFDMHTQAGGYATNIFMKNKAAKYEGLDRKKFKDVWFSFESGKIANYLINWTALKEDPGMMETMWALEDIRQRVAFGKNNPKQAKFQWDNQIRAEIKGAVRWVLEKRDSEEE